MTETFHARSLKHGLLAHLIDPTPPTCPIGSRFPNCGAVTTVRNHAASCWLGFWLRQAGSVCVCAVRLIFLSCFVLCGDDPNLQRLPPPSTPSPPLGPPPVLVVAWTPSTSRSCLQPQHPVPSPLYPRVLGSACMRVQATTSGTSRARLRSTRMMTCQNWCVGLRCSTGGPCGSGVIGAL